MKKFVVTMVLFVLMFTLYVPAMGETSVSPTLEDFYKVESEFIQKGQAHSNLMIWDYMIVDILIDDFGEFGMIDAEIEFPVLPKDLDYVFLFDGSHIASGQWIYTSGRSLHVYFWLDELFQFDRLNGIYLVLLYNDH